MGFASSRILSKALPAAHDAILDTIARERLRARGGRLRAEPPAAAAVLILKDINETKAVKLIR